MPTDPNSESRYNIMRRQMRFHTLSTAPIRYRAEVIAKHYLSLSVSAQHLLKVLELEQHSAAAVSEELIESLLEPFITEHRERLGLELAWPEDPSDDPDNGLAARLNHLLNLYGPVPPDPNSPFLFMRKSAGDIAPAESIESVGDIAGDDALPE